MPKKPYPYRKQFASAFLQDLADSFDRPVIGYHYNLGGYTPWPKVSRQYYLKTVKRMKKQGWLKEVRRGGKNFLKLTKKGRLQTLFCKLQDIDLTTSRSTNDWWIAVFDIPEREGHYQRIHLRKALLRAGFCLLQKSVYVCAHEIPEELLNYLKESGLTRFIRFLHVDYADDSKDLETRCAKHARKMQKDRENLTRRKSRGREQS